MRLLFIVILTCSSFFVCATAPPLLVWLFGFTCARLCLVCYTQDPSVCMAHACEKSWV